MPNDAEVRDVAPGPNASDLPRWDLSALYPGLDSPEFDRDFSRLSEDIDALLVDVDRLAETDPASEIEEASVARFERALAAMNDVEQRMDSLWAYLYGHVATDSRNDAAQARLSELQMRGVPLRKAGTRFVAWAGSVPIDRFIARSAMAEAHAFPLRKMHESAQFLMSPEEEALAADLSPSGGIAWSKLYVNLTSQISARIDLDGVERDLPMSDLRNLAMHEDRDVRRRAWETELATWDAHALPLAAALNGVKGQVLTLSGKRGWDDPLRQALFEANIDREIFDAMIGEARDAFPAFRRYLRLKANALGAPALAWYDLFAPLGRPSRPWTWESASAFIIEQFGSFSERMAGLARRAFSENWIDAGARQGKVGGAFCMWLVGDQSRILANFSPTYDGVTTLAHELGHAYHNLNEAGLTPLQRQTPMILAETASTFCETIVKEAAFADAGVAEQIYILEQSLQGACQVVVDILSRFDFERSLFAGRRERELSANDLGQLMLAAQEGTYGNALDASARHPYMWAAKGHYYRTEQSYYNFPYLFGLLFGLGLYAAFQREPATFPERYDALLASTGRAGAAELAAEFGFDLRSPTFWRQSLGVVRADIDRLEALLGSSLAGEE